MSKFIFSCIAVSVFAGCQSEAPSSSRPAAPQSGRIEKPSSDRTLLSSSERDDSKRDDSKRDDKEPDDREPDESERDDVADESTALRITAADAARIAKDRSSHQGKPKPEAVVTLLTFRACHQRAWDNAHGDPDLQGPVAFGDLEDLDRDGRCWSVEAQYGHWLEITYIDEVGNVIYQFDRGD